MHENCRVVDASREEAGWNKGGAFFFLSLRFASCSFVTARYQRSFSCSPVDVMWVVPSRLSLSLSILCLYLVPRPLARHSRLFRSVSFQAGLRAQLASIFDSNTLKQYPGPGVESRFNVLPRILSRVRKRLTTSRRGEFRACGGSLRTPVATPGKRTEPENRSFSSSPSSSSSSRSLCRFLSIFSFFNLPLVHSSLISYLSERFIAHGDQTARGQPGSAFRDFVVYFH